MKRLALIGVTTLAMSYAALANSAYVNVGAGVVWPMQNSSKIGNSNFVTYAPGSSGTGTFRVVNANWENKYSDAYEGTIALGTDVFTSWRIEGEFLYQNMQRKINGSYDWKETTVLSGSPYTPQLGNAIASTSTRLDMYSLLFNLYRDFKLKGKWTPFVGVGVGPAWVHSGATNANGTLVINGVAMPTIATSPELTNSALGWQLKAGVGYDFNQHFNLSVLYRLFGTTSMNAGSTRIVVNPNTTSTVYTVQGGSLKGLLNSAVDLNLRYTF